MYDYNDVHVLKNHSQTVEYHNVKNAGYHRF